MEMKQPLISVFISAYKESIFQTKIKKSLTLTKDWLICILVLWKNLNVKIICKGGLQSDLIGVVYAKPISDNNHSGI